MAPYGVFESHEAVADPPSGGAVPADVGKGLVIVTIWSAERHLLYGLVHNEILRETHARIRRDKDRERVKVRENQI